MIALMDPRLRRTSDGMDTQSKKGTGEAERPTRTNTAIESQRMWTTGMPRICGERSGVGLPSARWLDWARNNCNFHVDT